MPLALAKAMSGKRDSNPRPSAWEADALPTELLPQIFPILLHYKCTKKSNNATAQREINKNSPSINLL